MSSSGPKRGAFVENRIGVMTDLVGLATRLFKAQRASDHGHVPFANFRAGLCHAYPIVF